MSCKCVSTIGERDFTSHKRKIIQVYEMERIGSSFKKINSGMRWIGSSFRNLGRKMHRRGGPCSSLVCVGGCRVLYKRIAYLFKV